MNVQVKFILHNICAYLACHYLSNHLKSDQSDMLPALARLVATFKSTKSLKPAVAKVIYYFHVISHVITHKMVVSRLFYDLGGWLGPPQ